MTHPHARDLTISRGAFARLPNSQEKEREKVEDVRERGVQAIVIRSVVIANFVQASDC